MEGFGVKRRERLRFTDNRLKVVCWKEGLPLDRAQQSARYNSQQMEARYWAALIELCGRTRENATEAAELTGAHPNAMQRFFNELAAGRHEASIQQQGPCNAQDPASADSGIF